MHVWTSCPWLIVVDPNYYVLSFYFSEILSLTPHIWVIKFQFFGDQNFHWRSLDKIFKGNQNKININ